LLVPESPPLLALHLAAGRRRIEGGPAQPGPPLFNVHGGPKALAVVHPRHCALSMTKTTAKGVVIATYETAVDSA
jgi:hypothetical protein